MANIRGDRTSSFLKLLVFFWGFTWAMPLSYLPSFHGVKLDDLFLICLLFIFILIQKSNLKLIISIIAILIYCTVYLLYSLGEPALEPFPIYIRVIQCLLVILYASFLAESDLKRDAFNGVIFGGLISFFIFLHFILNNLELTLFVAKGSYIVKDSFQYNDSNPFSIHVNSLSNLFMFCFFCSVWCYQNSGKYIYKFSSFLFLAGPILMFTKGVILGVGVFAIILAEKKIRRKFGKTYLIAFLLSIVLLAILLTLSIENLFSLFTDYNITMSSRDSLYAGAISASFDNPLGYGFGSQNYIIEEYTGINYPAHNFFLSVLLELGLIALFFSLCFTIYFFLNVASKNHTYSLAVAVAFFITGMFGNLMYFYKLHFFIISFTLFTGWIHAKK